MPEVVLAAGADGLAGAADVTVGFLVADFLDFLVFFADFFVVSDFDVSVALGASGVAAGAGAGEGVGAGVCAYAPAAKTAARSAVNSLLMACSPWDSWYATRAGVAA
jgi:hypothetical protein